MSWVNDRIRVNYFAGVKGERILGKKIDSRDNVEWGREAEKNNWNLETIEELNFS